MGSTKDYLNLMSNRRKSARTDVLDVAAKISKDGEDWVRIDVSDISTGGFQFRSEEPSAAGDKVWLNMLVKSPMLASQNSLRIKTVALILDVRSEKDGVFVNGAKFTKLSARDESELGMMIQLMYEKYGRNTIEA